ncbi:MAG: CBS domain-containing protein [bacterium]
MTLELIKFSYLSEFLRLPVVRASDNYRIGKLVDVAASTGQVYPRITGLMVKTRNDRQPIYISWNLVTRLVFKEHLAVDFSPDSPRQATAASEHEILLCKSFLDKQIISTSGYKIVRVNDLQLLIEDKAKESTNLWVVHIDIGIKGLLRRLGFLRAVNAAFRWVTDRDIRDKFVSWKHVQPTTTSSVYSSVQLKTDASRLSEIHPADLADILEDLGTDERIGLIESLDHYTAAMTLQEIQFKHRLQIAESLEVEKLAQIINEMHSDEAVDLLDECPAEKRSKVYAALPEEKVAEIKELTQLSTYSVGSIMSTDFVTTKSDETVGTVLERIRVECEKAEMYRYAYVLDSQERLIGVVSLRQLLLNKAETLIADIMSEQPVTVEIDTRIRRVAQIFFKYNFEAIPVVDDEDRIQGVVSLRDALTAFFPEVKEEAALS